MLPLWSNILGKELIGDFAVVGSEESKKKKKKKK